MLRLSVHDDSPSRKGYAATTDPALKQHLQG
jgi:hypothetical protein